MSAPTAGPEIPQNVRYTYWPCSYLGGDPYIISPTPWPLSGVKFSVLARGVGELRATLQLADPTIRAMGPWEHFYPRKTGIVVIRTVESPGTGQLTHDPVWHGILWAAPKDPATGRMDLLFQTVESLWSRRLITGPPPMGQRDSAGNLLPSLSWTQADQAQIVRDLLDPDKFSQIGDLSGEYDFPGWITVEAPEENTGVPRDLTYARGSETNLLKAHQDRSKVINGYEWYTAIRVLDGEDAYSASTFRCQFIWGYPRLGRRYGVDHIPRLSYYTDGRGNVADIQYEHDGSSVSNVVWGTGSGYDDDALRVSTTNRTDWENGFLITEDRYSNPDVSRASTLQEQNDAHLLQGYANEQFVSSVTVRGDLFPHFGSYAIGDDCLVTTDDWTWPDRPDGTRGVTYVSRIMGWEVTPPEGDSSELVKLRLGGQENVA
jgi:hypothetical protein